MARASRSAVSAASTSSRAEGKAKHIVLLAALEATPSAVNGTMGLGRDSTLPDSMA
jgi:hypothetical protein